MRQAQPYTDRCYTYGMLPPTSVSAPVDGDGAHVGSDHAGAPAAATTFVGRERELGVLRGKLNDARAGRGGVASVGAGGCASRCACRAQ